MADEPTRPSLLLRLRDAADEEAWRAFMEVYAPVVYSYCRKHGLQDADAADVAQETLVQVARSMPGFVYDAGRGRFRDWLRTVARHKVARFAEKRRRTFGTADGHEALDALTSSRADAEWADEFHARVLHAALARIRGEFEPVTWRAFELVWQDRRSSLEAADELGLPVDLVYSAKSRVLRRLRQEVLSLADDLPPFVLPRD